MQNSQQNGDLLDPESKQPETRQSASKSNRPSESKDSIADTIKRLMRPKSIHIRRWNSKLDENKELRPGDLEHIITAADNAQNPKKDKDKDKEKNPNLKTTTVAITFSCECATRQAVEVDGVLVGDKLSTMISREIVEKRKSKSTIWPSVKVLGKVRRRSSAGNLFDENIQNVVHKESPSTGAKKWVVDTINKISGSLHCHRSVPP